MFVSPLNKTSKTDESDASSEHDIEKKYGILENNYRCLLGVTSVLTEALENIIRGSQFDLEEALNQCMKIYPGLFTVQFKRLRRSFPNHKVYTTPASDLTDIGENYDAENNNMRNEINISSRNIKNNNDYTVNIVDDINDINSQLSHLALRIKRNSTSSQISDVEYLKPTEMKDNRIFSRSNSQISQTTENAYTVKHPESDNEQQIKTTFTADTSKNSAPYEIVVQQNFPKINSNIERMNSKGDIVIKIKPPEMTELVEYTPDSAILKTSPRKPIVNNPLETCIIITNHMGAEVHNSEQPETKRSINYMNDDEDVLPSTSTNDVTMDKLQKLSTGLKVQKDVMQTMAMNKEESAKKTMSKLEHLQYINKYDMYAVTHEKEDDGDYYEKLKNDLVNSSVKDCSASLQSLRLKLIHTLAKERAELVTRYVENDILDIKKNITLVEKLLPKEIVNGWDLILQQIILKFINTMCSIWKGREYVTKNNKIMSSLQKHFFEKYKHRNGNDPVSQDMLMAIVHKISTKLNQHSILLSTGLLEQIFHNVSEGCETMSYYRLKHSLGILINTCVYEYGRNALESVNSEMLNLLTLLLNRKDKRITPFVARLIYVLMANDVFHKRAKEMNLVECLEKTINPANKRLKLQLNVLKSVIEESEPHKYLNGSEESFLANIEVEMDELEEEVETGEPLLTNNNYDNRKCKMNIEESPIRVKLQNSNEVQNRTKIPKLNENKKPEYPNRVKRKPQSKIAVRKKEASIPRKNQEKPLKKEKSKPIEEKKEQPKSEMKDQNKTEIKPRADELKSNNIHEIIESFDEMATSYIILNDPGISDIIQADLRIQEAEKQLSSRINQDSPLKSFRDKNANEDNNKTEHGTSFVLLSENESSKSTSIDMNLNLSSESIDSPEKIEIAIDGQNVNVISDNLSEEKLPGTSNNNYLMVHSRGSPKVSLFIQHGKITAIDYDYCEDTKEIQYPIKHGNLFKDRQSPYKDLLTESKKRFKMQPTTRIKKGMRSNTKSEGDKDAHRKIAVSTQSLNIDSKNEIDDK